MYQYEPVQKKEKNNTGIPEQLRTHFEQASGYSLGDVKVHYNSPLPRQVGALAYTQGSSVYMGPGQEQHLGHELAHVVQQKQGIVRATGQVNGQPLNDDRNLENAADKMAGKWK